jgi:hypothetical protein
MNEFERARKGPRNGQKSRCNRNLEHITNSVSNNYMIISKGPKRYKII